MEEDINWEALLLRCNKAAWRVCQDFNALNWVEDVAQDIALSVVRKIRLHRNVDYRTCHHAGIDSVRKLLFYCRGSKTIPIRCFSPDLIEYAAANPGFDPEQYLVVSQDPTCCWPPTIAETKTAIVLDLKQRLDREWDQMTVLQQATIRDIIEGHGPNVLAEIHNTSATSVCEVRKRALERLESPGMYRRAGSWHSSV